jgi:prepilin-type N-terminal cleavage/methylation domain-containing protein
MNKEKLNMTALRRILKRDAFTLIELLVVIAIISLLAAILTPAINTALLKGRLTQALGNGSGLYKMLFAEEMANPLGLESAATASWPTDGDYADATDYFATLATNDTLGISFSFFALPGINAARSETEFLDGELRCGWAITLDVSDRMKANAPVIFTQNIILDGDAIDGAGDPLLDELSDPFGDRGAVVVWRGGSAFSLDRNTAIATNFNPTTADNGVLYPKNSETGD